MTTYTLIGSATDTQDNITFSTTSINVQVQNTWPNEPLGLTVVTDYDLVPVPIPVTQSEVALTNSWISIYNGRGLLKKDSDSTEPVTPPSVLRCDFPIGFTGGEGPGTLARSLPGFRRIYGGFSVKVLSPWQGHNTSVNKLSYFVVNGGSCPLVFYFVCIFFVTLGGIIITSIQALISNIEEFHNLHLPFIEILCHETLVPSFHLGF